MQAIFELRATKSWPRLGNLFDSKESKSQTTTRLLMKIKHWIGLMTVLLLVWAVLSRQERASPSGTPTGTVGSTSSLGADTLAQRTRSGALPDRKRKEQEPVKFQDQLIERAHLKRQTYLTSASVLIGRAIDPEGNGISGVALELIGESGSDLGAVGFQGDTVSGAEGAFRLDLTDGFGGWIMGSAAGYAPIRQRVWSAGPGEVRLVLVLTPWAGTLKVTVSEVFSRRIVGGARVEARIMSFQPTDQVTTFECLTDESGECQIQHLPAQRRVRVMASMRGHFEGTRDIRLSPGSAHELALKVIKGPTLVLQVLPLDGEAVPGATIGRPDGLAGSTDTRGEIWMPVIDELVEVPVQISASGYRSSQATLINDGTLQKVELEPAPILSGQVLDPTGDPISGVHVMVRKLPTEPLEESLTDRSGYFEIPIPDPSSLRLFASRQWFSKWEEEFNLEKPLPNSIVITLRPYSSVVMGQLLSPGRRPATRGPSFFQSSRRFRRQTQANRPQRLGILLDWRSRTRALHDSGQWQPSRRQQSGLVSERGIFPGSSRRNSDTARSAPAAPEHPACPLAPVDAPTLIGKACTKCEARSAKCEAPRSASQVLVRWLFHSNRMCFVDRHVVTIEIPNHKRAHPSTVVGIGFFLERRPQCLRPCPRLTEVVNDKPEQNAVLIASLSRLRECRPVMIALRPGGSPMMEAQQDCVVRVDNLIKDFISRVRLLSLQQLHVPRCAPSPKISVSASGPLD